MVLVRYVHNSDPKDRPRGANHRIMQISHPPLLSKKSDRVRRGIVVEGISISLTGQDLAI